MSDDLDHNLLFIPPSIHDHSQGVLSATVVLVMYGDYQSPQSADAYRLIRAIQRQIHVSFGEDYLCFIFRHFPQTPIHLHARRAAEAAEAAAAQGQFWQMHEMLLDHSQALGNGYLVEYANDLGLDIPQFLQALSGGVHRERIQQDIDSGRHSGVVTDPALFINGIRYAERWKVKQLIAAIVTASNQVSNS